MGVICNSSRILNTRVSGVTRRVFKLTKKSRMAHYVATHKNTCMRNKLIVFQIPEKILTMEKIRLANRCESAVVSPFFLSKKSSKLAKASFVETTCYLMPAS